MGDLQTCLNRKKATVLFIELIQILVFLMFFVNINDFVDVLYKKEMKNAFDTLLQVRVFRCVIRTEETNVVMW